MKPSELQSKSTNETPMVKPLQINWCRDHWANLMYGLQDRGLGALISPSRELLQEKFDKGELDPCYEGTMALNIAALQFFTPQTLLNKYKGCPICAFSDITNHVCDGMAKKFTESK